MKGKSEQSFSIIPFLMILNCLVLLLTSQKFSVIFIFLLCLFSINFIVYKIDRQRIMTYYLIGVLVLVGFYFYWIFFYGNSYFLGRMSDDWQYDVYWTENFIERYGFNLSRLPEHLNTIERGLGILHNSQGYVGFVIILRWIASFFDGYHTLMPRIFNIYILSLIAYFSSNIAFFYTDSIKVKRNVQAVVFFFPVMLFNSVHVFRDTIVSFLLIFIYYTLIRNKYSIQNLLLVVFSMLILILFRTSTFFVAILMILLLYFNPQKIRARLILAGVIFAFIGSYFLQDFASVLSRQIAGYNQLNIERFGGIGSKIFELPIYLGVIPRIIYMIFTPVPNLSSFHQIYLSISAFMQVFTIPFLYFGLISKKIDLKLKITFLLFFFGIALSTATFRHVMMYLPFGIIITILSINQRREDRNLFKGYPNKLIILFTLFVLSILVALIN